MGESNLAELNQAEPDTLRLFFALCPDDATRDALNRTSKWLHQHWGGQRMRAETLHLTLAFLGATPARKLDQLIACADAVKAQAYELVLDQAGYWHYNHIGWLGTSAMPPQHAALVGQLNTQLQAAGFPVDPRPHVPHVTLLRNVPGGAGLACDPVRWGVSDFVLVASRPDVDGANYRVVKRWVLV